MVVTKAHLLRGGNDAPEGTPEEPKKERRSLSDRDKGSRRVLLVFGVVLVLSLATLGYLYLKHSSEVAQVTAGVPTHLPVMPLTSPKPSVVQGSQAEVTSTQAPTAATPTSTISGPLDPTSQLTATKNPFTPLVSSSAASH